MTDQSIRKLTKEAQQYEYICETCGMFACPIFMKYPKVNGCNYGPDILNQLKKSKGRKSKSRDFEEVCKELVL